MRSPTISLRLLLVSVALPAVVVALDDFALRFGAAHRWSAVPGVAVSSWFVVQMAVLSYLAGSKLPSWGWRLLLVCWMLVLVNLLLGTSAAGRWNDQRLLALAFLSAEFGALAVWLILGSGWLGARVALVVLASLPVKMLADALGFHLRALRWGDAWSIIVAVQIAATSALAALLRVAGYRIECEEQTGETRGPVQFSIRHLLIATTVVAVLVPVVQGLLRSSSPWMGAGQWLHASVDGVVLALVSLAALWTALGTGRWPIKLLVFVLLAVAAGGGLHWLEATARYRYSFSPYMSQPLTEAGWRWTPWALLTGAFLAGMLLVLRATGFRLARRRR